MHYANAGFSFALWTNVAIPHFDETLGWFFFSLNQPKITNLNHIVCHTLLHIRIQSDN